jgi:hypothetical protein
LRQVYNDLINLNVKGLLGNEMLGTFAKMKDDEQVRHAVTSSKKSLANNLKDLLDCQKRFENNLFVNFLLDHHRQDAVSHR